MRARDLEIQKAVLNERGRCLWCCDQVLAELRAGLQTKILVESEIHVVKVKVKLAEAIIAKIRRAVVAGAKPRSTENPRNGHQEGPPQPDSAGA